MKPANASLDVKQHMLLVLLEPLPPLLYILYSLQAGNAQLKQNITGTNLSVSTNIEGKPTKWANAFKTMSIVGGSAQSDHFKRNFGMDDSIGDL